MIYFFYDLRANKLEKEGFLLFTFETFHTGMDADKFGSLRNSGEDIDIFNFIYFNFSRRKNVQETDFCQTMKLKDKKSNGSDVVPALNTEVPCVNSVPRVSG